MSTPNLDAVGHRWVASLAGFNFTIEYLKGMDNKVADALSRVGNRLELDTNSVRKLLSHAKDPMVRGPKLTIQGLCSHMPDKSKKSSCRPICWKIAASPCGIWRIATGFWPKKVSRLSDSPQCGWSVRRMTIAFLPSSSKGESPTRSNDSMLLDRKISSLTEVCCTLRQHQA